MDPAPTATPRRLTVCICTRNRPVDLERALASIGASSRPVAQVIVSDDSTDEKSRILVGEKFPDVTFIEGPRRGLCANRNAALDAATGSHVLFLDDDAGLGEDFLEIVERAMPSDGDGRVIVSGRERTRGNLIEPKRPSYLGYQERLYRPGESLHTTVMNATVFPMAAFERERFDEQLRYGSDEVDYCARAVATGFRIELVREAVNEHYSSQVNRAEYATHMNASRLYVGLKRRAFVDRNPPAAIAYLLIGTAHLLWTSFRRDPATALRATAATLGTCLTSFATYVRHPTDRRLWRSV